MTERLTEKQITEITNAAIEAPGYVFKLNGREWCIQLLDEVERLNQQLTEKDATIERLTAESAIKSEAIKKYENDAEYWYQETENARSMFLAAHDDKVRLRNALEESEQRIKSVNEGIDEGPQFGMTAWDWRDWLYSTLPFLKEPSEEGDKQ